MDLYHYTSSNGLFGIIDSCELQCTNASFLNDPTEKKYFDSVLKEVISKNSACANIYKILNNSSVVSHIVNPFEHYIISFCKNKDSLSMWNYYSKGNGYNLGFNIESIIKRNNDKFHLIKKVDLIYSRLEQLSSLERYILNYKDKSEKYLQLKNEITFAEQNGDRIKYDIANYEQSNCLIDFSEGLFEMQLKFKNEAYKNEKEVRLIVSQWEPEGLISSHKISSTGIIIEYVSLELNLLEDLTSITTNPLSNELHKLGLSKFLNSKIENKKIDINKSEIPFRLI